jgi:hypothetical protein
MTQLHLDHYSCHVILHVPLQLLVAMFIAQNEKHMHVAGLPYRKVCQLVTVPAIGIFRFCLMSFYCYIVPNIIIRHCYMAFVSNLLRIPPPHPTHLPLCC